MTDNDQITWGKKNIVKVQVPLASNEDNPPALIYSHDDSIMTSVPVDDELLAKMEGEDKKYFYFRRHEDGQIELLNEAGNQDW